MPAPHPKVLRNFVFTWNNPTFDGPAFLLHLRAALPCRYIIFQLEEGEEHTPHFQGYVELSKQTRFNTVADAFDGGKAHLEARKGTPREAQVYASKEETRVDGPWEYGQISKQGARTDLADAVASLRTGGISAVVEQHPEQYVKFGNGLSRLHTHLTKYVRRDPPTVTLLFGAPDSGKSHMVWDREPQLVQFGKDLQWFDNYAGEEAVLFDEFAGEGTLKFLLQLLDRYPLQLPIKGSHVTCQFKRIYITSNYHPRDWYDWTNREQQYPALVRRFTNVYWWPVGGRDHRSDYVALDPTSDRWDAFWRGPTPVTPVPLGPLDDYVIQPEPKSYYNFM